MAISAARGEGIERLGAAVSDALDAGLSHVSLVATQLAELLSHRGTRSAPSFRSACTRVNPSTITKPPSSPVITVIGLSVGTLLAGAVIFVKIVPVGLEIWGSIQLIGMLKRLEAVEKAHAAGADPNELLEQLNELDRRTAKLFMPRSMVHDYIDDRQFLHDMRERIAGTSAIGEASSSEDH